MPGYLPAMSMPSVTEFPLKWIGIGLNGDFYALLLGVTLSNGEPLPTVLLYCLSFWELAPNPLAVTGLLLLLNWFF